MTETDFVSAHLSWVKRNPSFSPKYAQDIEPGRTYYQSLSDFYCPATTGNTIPQTIAKMMYKSDREWFENSKVIDNLISKEIINEKKLIPTAWFVTIGFNHQTWNAAKCVKAITNIIDFDWIISCKANFELFRENGEHPHCHFYMTTYEPKSRILEKLFRPKYVKDIVLKGSFIDIKKAELYHIDYINLVKTDGKMSYVNQDIEWRLKNNVPNFEKNWLL